MLKWFSCSARSSHGTKIAAVDECSLDHAGEIKVNRRNDVGLLNFSSSYHPLLWKECRYYFQKYLLLVVIYLIFINFSGYPGERETPFATSAVKEVKDLELAFKNAIAVAAARK